MKKPEEIDAAKDLHSKLNEVALSVWKGRGAKFGERQKLSEIDTTGTTLSLPVKFTPETEFITFGSDIEAGGYNGRTISCPLWVKPIKKNGEPGSAIRLTAITLYDYLLY
jgi:hypothetical protein